jgi:transposase-like protein
MKKCKKCNSEMVVTGDIIVLSDGYELEEYKCKKCDK